MTRIETNVRGGAEYGINETGSEAYRYRLWRELSEGLVDQEGRVLFVMLNPSTADASFDDNTIRRCMGFARREGFAVLDVVNLFAFRARNPRRLDEQADPVGPFNDRAIESAALAAQAVVFAWGALPDRRQARAAQVWNIVEDANHRPYCLGTTRDGHPRHPLYVRRDAPLELFGG